MQGLYLGAYLDSEMLGTCALVFSTASTHMYMDVLKDCYLLAGCTPQFLNLLLSVVRMELFMPNKWQQKCVACVPSLTLQNPAAPYAHLQGAQAVRVCVCVCDDAGKYQGARLNAFSMPHA
eukprot:scaffold38377_cov20-Tisochrysis_lutea.AAC.1